MCVFVFCWHVNTVNMYANHKPLPSFLSILSACLRCQYVKKITNNNIFSVYFVGMSTLSTCMENKKQLHLFLTILSACQHCLRCQPVYFYHVHTAFFNKHSYPLFPIYTYIIFLLLLSACQRCLRCQPVYSLFLCHI